MRKFILIFILSILLIVFSVLIYKAYTTQKGYFLEKNKRQSEDQIEDLDQVTTMPSYYVDYQKADYDKALIEKRVLVLYFTSNWCKECIDQEDINNNVFAEMSSEGLIGLRIHILDSETTLETDALARKFDISKEQSFIVLDKNGVVTFKHVGALDNETFKSVLLKAKGV